MNILINLSIVFLGGALGSTFRYILTLFIPNKIYGGFDLATFVTNMVGCFLIGIVFYLSDKYIISENRSLFLKVGIMGGFTTFSSFALVSLNLFKNHSTFLVGVAYILLSVLISLLMVYMGEKLAEFISYLVKK
jgi:CrcB protein